MGGFQSGTDPLDVDAHDEADMAGGGGSEGGRRGRAHGHHVGHAYALVVHKWFLKTGGDGMEGASTEEQGESKEGKEM